MGFGIVFFSLSDKIAVFLSACLALVPKGGNGERLGVGNQAKSIEFWSDVCRGVAEVVNGKASVLLLPARKLGWQKIGSITEPPE